MGVSGRGNVAKSLNGTLGNAVSGRQPTEPDAAASPTHDVCQKSGLNPPADDTCRKHRPGAAQGALLNVASEDVGRFVGRWDAPIKRKADSRRATRPRPQCFQGKWRSLGETPKSESFQSGSGRLGRLPPLIFNGFLGHSQNRIGPQAASSAAWDFCFRGAGVFRAVDRGRGQHKVSPATKSALAIMMSRQ